MVSKKKILYWLGALGSALFVVLEIIINFSKEDWIVFIELMKGIFSNNPNILAILGTVASGIVILGKIMSVILQKFDSGERKASRYLGVVMDAFERMGERNDENIRKTNKKIDKLIEDSVVAKDEIKEFRERLLRLEKQKS